MLCVCVVLKLATEMLFIIVNSLKDQLEDLKKRNQNSQISTEKVNQLQRQVGSSQFSRYGLTAQCSTIPEDGWDSPEETGEERKMISASSFFIIFFKEDQDHK